MRSSSPSRWLFSLALALAWAAAAPGVSAQRPNLILIVADDLGYGDLGSYGQTRIHTPALDRLASEGTRLTAAYATAPICAPSRCSILTGLHAGHCAVTTNAEPNTPLGADDATIAEVLSAAGYRTAVMGKWALGGEIRDGTPFATWSAPWNVGFDTALVTLDQELAQDHYPAWLWRADSIGEGAREDIAVNLSADVVFDEERFVTGALAFIDEAVAEDRPFFLYVPLTLPHRELNPPDLGVYADERWPEAERAYAAMVTQIDLDVARITERLEARGVRDRTILVFTSDNGPTSIDGHSEAFFESSGGLRGQKRDLYEGGTRVPLLAWGPGVARGARIDVPVSLTDLLPTLADLAGAERPSGIDGVSIAEGLREGTLTAPHAAIFLAVERGMGSEPGTRRALRAGDLKVLERSDGTVELYDLAADPFEAHDIAAERRTEVDALRARIAVEARPRPAAEDPALRLVGEGVSDHVGNLARSSVPVLHLLFDSAGADEVDDPGASARIESVVSPALTATRHEGDVPYVTVPAHPALSFGDASFTLEAFVRLEAAGRPGDREWLVLSKQTGRTDAFIDFGVLARAGDLAHGERMIGANAERSGRELAVVFGDPRLGHLEPWGVVSSLAIDDGEVHRVTVRFDAPRDRVRFSIDERTETFEILDRGHVTGDGPLVFGAHHDEHGTFAQALRGELLEVRLSRGLVPIGHRLERGQARSSGDTVTIDLGRVVLGSAPVERRFRVESAGDGRLRGMDVRIEPDTLTDDRVELRGPMHGTLFSRGDRTRPVTLTFDPRRAGALDATLLVRGTVRRRGWPAARSPLRVRVIATVVSDASDPAEDAGSVWAAVVLGGLLVAPLLVLAALARRPRKTAATSDASR